MTEARPNPDELLARVQAEETGAARGSLKIFLGYAAGVGKTWAMLDNARRARAAGREVVVGYVEPHGRRETEVLLEGLEALPTRAVQHRAMGLREFDLDAALARRPDLLLVDELAHTNAPGSRHEKRWQDVEELLAAGINVWTTLNVQHLESLNDVIGQITGVTVRETLPDHVLEQANDLELVDITPEELLERLAAGKVYLPEQARRASGSFFQKPNLAALRELALREAARRVHSDVEDARRDRPQRAPWATSERLLVCVGPSPTTARVIRTAKRMADSLDAPWLAVAVDLGNGPATSRNQQLLADNFRLAERLGAETATIPGQRVSAAVIELARARNVTRILVGKTSQPRWRRFLQGSVVDELIEQSGPIDVLVVEGREETAPPLPGSPVPQRREWSVLPKALLPVALAGGLVALLRWLRLADAEANTVMIFLAAVAWAAWRYGRWPAILASVLSVLVFDFFFVPPFLTFAVSDVQYVVTFLVMLFLGLLISATTARLHGQVANARRRERQTTLLRELGKQLSALCGRVFLASAAGSRIAEISGGEVAIYLRQDDGRVDVVFGHASPLTRDPVSQPAAQWVSDHDQLAGRGTNTLPNAAALFLPVTGSQQTLGAIAIRREDSTALLDPEMRRLLESCAGQLALALERDQLTVDAAEARIEAETERIRNSLLSSVSHDLKTPLAVIAGSSSSLLEAERLDPGTRQELLETVHEEAGRLNRLLDNILQMSRLDAGAAQPNRQWHVLEELVGSALQRTTRELQQHPVETRLPGSLPLLFVDGLLLEQVFVNLLENAARHTPPGTRIEIGANLDGSAIRIMFADNGPGLPAGDEERIFEKFYRAVPAGDGGRGSGLGLAICRAIVLAHGGRISAANRPGGGAMFTIQLPQHPGAPRMENQT